MRSICLVTVGAVDEETTGAVTASALRSFSIAVRRGESLPKPAFAYSQVRKQYDSTLILLRLSRVVPADAFRLLAVTECDLFIPILSFVFGHAQFQGAVALISLARLRQEYYGLPSNPSLLHNRAVKESLHELGHTLGLVHCNNTACPMSLSTNIRQVDIKGTDFCESCGSEVRRALPPRGEPKIFPNSGGHP